MNIPVVPRGERGDCAPNEPNPAFSCCFREKIPLRRKLDTPMKYAGYYGKFLNMNFPSIQIMLTLV